MTPPTALSGIAAALPAHALSGVAGWADEFISFGFIIGIIVVLMVMSRLGRRKRRRSREQDRR